MTSFTNKRFFSNFNEALENTIAHNQALLHGEYTVDN